MPDRILQRRILLADGRELRTVSEASALIEERFNGTRCDALDRTRALLVTAASTGKRGDIQAATAETIAVLQQAKMLRTDVRTRAYARVIPNRTRRNGRSAADTTGDFF